MQERIELRPAVRFPSDSRAPDWSRVPQRGHGVQFYRSDNELLRLLTRYVGSALVGGDVALVVATRSHRRGLERRLATRGLDVSIARRENRYLACDPAAMIDKFVRLGRVDVESARHAIRTVLTRACAVRRADGPLRVFAFGEMVALIAEEYGAVEALTLEEVWNSHAAEFNFTLCCAYPMAMFGPGQAAPFIRICGLHSHVFHATDRGV